MLLVALAFGISLVQAQSGGPELGLRFGGGNKSTHSSIDGVLPLSDVNRLHGDLSFGDGYLALEGLYEWQFPIGEGFMIYPGVGAGMYSYSYSTDGYWTGGKPNVYINPESGTRMTLGVLGVIGLEYQIEPIPLTVGIDFRTGFGFSHNYGLGFGGALICRYRF